MKILLYILLGLITLLFIAGIVAAVVVGSKKNRRKFALSIFISFSEDAKSMILEIFRLHQIKRIGEINDIVAKATNTTNEIISILSPEKRLQEFSSGKTFDQTT